MVDNRSVVDILYLNAYKRMGLTEDDLDPNSSPLYEFSRSYCPQKGSKVNYNSGGTPSDLDYPR